MDSLVEIQDRSDRYLDGVCTMTFSEIISSIVNFMLKNEDSTLELKIKRIRILRKLIELENPKMTTKAADWDSSDYQDYLNSITKRQNQLADLGVVEMIFYIIKNESSQPQILEQLILLSIALLLGGNKKVQNEFLKQF